MKPLHVIVALVVTVAALLSLGPGLATDYANNPNPACREKRNLVAQARVPAAPNEATTQAVVAANRIGDFSRALVMLVVMDKQDTAALRTLAPTLPNIDDVIDRHLFNLTFARSILGQYLREGKPNVPQRLDDAVAVLQRAVDTSFTDDRGCEHRVYASFEARTYLAAMYLYGVGTAPDRAKARKLMANDTSANPKAIVSAIDRNRLPPNYETFLHVADNELDPKGRSLAEKQNEEHQKIALEILGFRQTEWSPWLGYLVAGVVIALIAIVIFAAFLELRRGKDGVAGKIGGLSFDELRAAFGRVTSGVIFVQKQRIEFRSEL